MGKLRSNIAKRSASKHGHEYLPAFKLFIAIVICIVLKRIQTIYINVCIRSQSDKKIKKHKWE